MYAAIKGSSGSRAQGGFSLVELMIVVVIAGVLVGVAIASVSSDGYGRTVHGFADEIAATMETARQRSVARSRFQRIVIGEQEVLHWEATTTGLREPDDWELIGRIDAPSADVFVHAFSPRTHIQPGDSVPSQGTGLDASFDFAPDGAGQAGTVFVGRSSGSEAFRVGVYPATGTVAVWEEW